MTIHHKIIRLGEPYDVGTASENWVAMIGDTGADGNGDSYYQKLLAKDPTGGIAWAINNSNSPVVAKLNDNATRKVEYRLTTNTGHPESLVVDSSGNIYLGVAGVSADQAQVIKISNSNNITWQKYLANSAGFKAYPNGIDVDSSGNVYVCGGMAQQSDNPIQNNYGFVQKLNSSGTSQWQKGFNSTGASGVIYKGATCLDCCLDSTGTYLYVVGGYDDNTWTQGFIAKIITSTGNIEWQRYHSRTSNIAVMSVNVDSSGDIVIGGADISSQPFVAKYSSAGALQWGSQVDTSGDLGLTGYPTCITTDSLDNIYVIMNQGNPNNGGTSVIIKYNSAGVIQWGRTWSNNTRTEASIHGVVIDDDDENYFYISGYTQAYYGSIDGFIGRLPSDGTGTGTYGVFNYAVYTPTEAADTLAQSTPSLNYVTTGYATGNTGYTRAYSRYELNVEEQS